MPRQPYLLLLTAAACWCARDARAEDAGAIEPFDADGDGDIDAADLEILRAAEQVEIVDKSEGQQLRESARAVTVIDTRQARERTADLGEVLSRAQGIQVRRSGGLGSAARFSLNGLYDDQIRFFLDGVPLELAGWGLGVANVPVELVQRIEVHRGVVPISLGADALGGAVNLVTDPSWVNRASASYQTGSFGTHRVTSSARARDDDTGLALGLALFVDRARNDYPIDVELTDARGKRYDARVRRFHDAYTAAGGSIEGGVVGVGPVQRALLRVFSTDYDKELQHNIWGTLPYGDATYGEQARGVTLDVALEHGAWRGRMLAGVARRRIDFRDVGMHVYDWTGERVRDRAVAGENGPRPVHQRVSETGVFARLLGERALGDHQRVRATFAPTVTSRDGTDFLDSNPAGRDPIQAKRELAQAVAGVEHELTAADDRLQNIAFLKLYAMWTDAEDARSDYIFVPVTQSTHEVGFGDAARYRLTEHLALKASYEWATRLPSVDEIFGDGILIQPNLALRPERSHNVNLGVRYEAESSRGAITAETNTFARLVEDLIAALGTDRLISNQNVAAARILGVEGSAGYVVPGDWASIDASITLQDIRNASSSGPYGAFEGDRLPNRPWLLGSLGGTLRKRSLVRSDDELSVFANSRYVREFFLGWESAGLADTKAVVASQLVHNVGVTYAVRSATPVLTTVELQNVTDARAFDSFGVQRPGRALYVKVSTEL